MEEAYTSVLGGDAAFILGFFVLQLSLFVSSLVYYSGVKILRVGRKKTLR
jgi:hypothetical protein